MFVWTLHTINGLHCSLWLGFSPLALVHSVLFFGFPDCHNLMGAIDPSPFFSLLSFDLLRLDTLPFDLFHSPSVASSGAIDHPWYWHWNVFLEAQGSAQKFDQDLVGQFKKAFQTFVESGQIWALLIGLIIGYVFRNLTTYS